MHLNGRKARLVERDMRGGPTGKGGSVRGLALHFAYYKFCRTHSTIRRTPAMEAGLAKSVWPPKDLLHK